MREALRAAWARWKAFAEVVAHVQAKILLTVLYFLIFAPFALIVRFWTDPLDLRRVATSRWRLLERQTLTLGDARRQF